MECPSCGAISKKRSMKCPECGAFRNKSSAPSQRSTSNEAVRVRATIPSQNDNPPHPRSLIEFPGVRNAMPQWRKELGERVREVQEKRLRENALETGATQLSGGEDGFEGSRGPLLELLPQAEVSPLNPLVVAALRRIERANVPPQMGGNFASFSGAAVAYAEAPEFTSDLSGIADDAGTASLSDESSPQPTSPHLEKVHNLAVVPNPPSSSELVDAQLNDSGSSLKPKRIIGGDLNDPALNYLDTIPTPRVDDCAKRAPIPLRILGSLIDLAVIALLTFLPLSLVGLTDFTGQDQRVITLGLGTLIVVAFLYLTISTALTGRTLGMKLFSLRVVDARTRMLPTGSQSAGRAAVYLLSIASTGIPLLYTFIDREKRAIHDRFTRTEVVRI